MNRAGMSNCATIEPREADQHAGDVKCHEQSFYGVVSGWAGGE